jgi:hypothetical protein
MAASALTVVPSTRAGANPGFTAANVDGNYFANSGAEVLIVTNGGGSSITVTVVSQATVDGLAVAIPSVHLLGRERIRSGHLLRGDHGQRRGAPGDARGVLGLDLAGHLDMPKG